ncbi:MAG: hydrogenase expression/formation protein HypE [Phycisphaerae bacterium]
MNGPEHTPPAQSFGVCPAPLGSSGTILLGHGGGGRLSADLIARIFRPAFNDDSLDRADDAAVLALAPDDSRAAFTTDAHIVHPLEFPGGDIGRLAVCGTVNDLAVMGARPAWLSAAFIIEEGFSIDRLARLAASMASAAREAGVRIVAGDTKVAPRGAVDGLMICTAGVGFVPEGRSPHAAGARPGDAVVLSGPIGNHGIAVLAARGELAFRTGLRSDTRPLNSLIEQLFDAGIQIHAMRDPTRGGLASTLNEIAAASRAEIVIEEDAIPIDPEVAAACEMLGFDPLHIANEGKVVAFVPEDQADLAVAVMRRHPAGTDARRIGRVQDQQIARVLLRTSLGPTRIVELPAGELLPRIC